MATKSQNQAGSVEIEGMDEFLSQSQEMGLGMDRQSEPDGVYAIVGLKYDSEVVDKEGQKSLLIRTANGQVRLYPNSHRKTIAILTAIVKSGKKACIAYYHEPREKGNGTWLRVRVGSEETMKDLYAFLNGKPKAGSVFSKPASKPANDVPTDDSMPF